MNVKIFVTGGTFDKEYDEINGKLFFKESHVREMLELGRNRVEVSVLTLMMEDSLEMTMQDRLIIVENCRKAEQQHIVITHGTDTMTTTAQVLAKAKIDKTIVLTGAMIPYKFGSSDGLFNLGSALAFSQSLPHGVYVAMNGKYFDYDKVKKNKKTGVFERIDS